MKYIILRSLIFFSCLTTTASAMSLTKRNISKCNIPFTQEQRKVLAMAYAVGSEYDLGNTLQAIVIQESFIGKRIDRHREVSIKDSSYGLMHMRPLTSVYTAFKVGMYEITLEESKTFLTASEGDILALHLGVNYLLILQKQSNSWSETVGRYNAGKYWDHGQGRKYTESVRNNLHYVMECFYTTPVVTDNIIQ